MKVQNHKYANIFPSLTEQEYQELKSDIEAHGLINDIWVYQGQILDGRNRHRALSELGKPIQTKEYTGSDPLGFAISLNLKRRHLTASQRAALAVELLPEFEQQAKERQGTRNDLANIKKKFSRSSQPSSEQAGDALNVNQQYVKAAKKIKQEHPDKFEAIKTGESTIQDVKKEIKKQERIEKVEEVREQLEAKPHNGLYDVIVCDPPWDYSEVGGFTSSQHDPDSNRGGVDYPTMTLQELSEMDIPGSESCVMLLWTTHKFLPKSFDLLKHWGFEYKAIITWDKQKMGMGRTIRIQCEFCLIGFKGKPIFQGEATRDIISESRREHSRKPDAFYELVEKTTIGRKLEMFSRQQREGWDQHGNDTGKF